MTIVSSARVHDYLYCLRVQLYWQEYEQLQWRLTVNGELPRSKELEHSKYYAVYEYILKICAHEYSVNVC